MRQAHDRTAEDRPRRPMGPGPILFSIAPCSETVMTKPLTAAASSQS